MTQAELEALPKELERIFKDLEERIMEDVVRRIVINDFSTPSADWQITRLQQLGESEDNIKKWIQKALGAADEEIEQIFSDDVYSQYTGNERAYKINGMEQIAFENNAPLQQLIGAAKRQISLEYQNLANSMGFAIRDAAGNIQYSPLMEFYRNTLDNAVIDIQSGAFSYQTVLTRTINAMTTSGLRWIDYDSGHHNRVDVAARRAVMTGFRQVQGKINEQVAAALGTDSYEVTYHVGARPTHQPWQGRVWTMRQLVDVCGLGDVTGLHGANCYHDYNAFIPGVSIRTYTDEQLDQMIAEENTPKAYLGKEYTTYEALQQQRKMETAMRKYRMDIHLLEEGKADEREIVLKKAKYQGKMQEYKAFSKAMNLPMQKDRIYQDGLSRKMKSEGGQRIADYLVRNHSSGINTTKERAVVAKTISSLPHKVIKAINKGTVVDVGKLGASQYDYINDILYVARGAEETEVLHEIGHLVENKLVNKKKAEALKKKLLQNVPPNAIITDTYYDAAGKPREIFLLDIPGLVSEYQGRLYVSDWSEIYDENWNVKPELVAEFISEPFREFMENPQRLQNEFLEFYDLIKEAVE